MTRKDYCAIAYVMAGTRPNCSRVDPIHVQWTYTVHVMADKLERDYENFNREVFMKACIA